MKAYFATLFDDARHERFLIFLLCLTDPNILKQSKFRDHEVNSKKSWAPEKLHRQKCLKINICFAIIGIVSSV